MSSERSSIPPCIGWKEGGFPEQVRFDLGFEVQEEFREAGRRGKLRAVRAEAGLCWCGGVVVGSHLRRAEDSCREGVERCPRTH